MAETDLQTSAHVATVTADAEAFGVRVGVLTAAFLPVVAIIAAIVLAQIGQPILAGFLGIPGILGGSAQVIAAVRGRSPSAPSESD